MKIIVCFFAVVAVCLGQAESEPEQICPAVCPANYDPICCTYGDGTTKTYSNNCAAAVYNCQYKTSCTKTAPGDCVAEPKPCAQAMCLDVYKPVCCTYADGTTKTFGNTCEASNYDCEQGTHCEAPTDGECDTFHILPFPYEPQVFVPAVMPPAEA